jgi:UDP-3-O-[3-hydroxymyristoyl] N-acetylglucosamine deacetylase
MCTALECDGVRISTVEHVMAALAGCGIDNLLIEINGPELPIMDGSAWPFVFLIECAGVAELETARRFLKILRPVTLATGNRSVALRPAEGFAIDFEVDYGNGAIARQRCEVDVTGGAFKNELSRARTFGFLHEVDLLRANGLALGGSLDNSVVISGDNILNEDGLRFADEFVRHKVLDAIGDLALAGAPLLGHFRGVRSGHALNRQVLEALFADEDAWCMTTLSRARALDAAGWDEPIRVRA